MEKFIVADGCALRISDTPKSHHDSVNRLNNSALAGHKAGRKSSTKASDRDLSGSAPTSGDRNLVDSNPSGGDLDRNLVGSDPSGSGRTVLLLHGFLESLDVWEDFTRLLTPYARVVALDLPGHGISEVKGPIHTMEFLADVVYDALRQLDVVKCTVIGHSMGGYVALALAARHPEVLDGLVLFSSTPNADSDAKKIDREREIAIIESGRKELLSRTLPSKGFAPDNREKFADQIEDLAELIMLTEENGVKALIRGMMQRADMNQMLQQLKVPQLFIFGRHDKYIATETALAVIAANPQAHVAWLEDSGHNGYIEQPTEAARTILDFIKVDN